MWVESSHADLRETGIGGKMRKIGVKLGTIAFIMKIRNTKRSSPIFGWKIRKPEPN